ncbi:MAG: SDR family NAD(P)-dependent oxidoreductase, partial [Ignavibacteriaceae bacterium]
MKLGLKGKTALITAASKGIGKAVAEALASEGCQVVICSRTKDDLIETAREIREKYHVDPLWCICDLNKSSDIDNTYEAVK